jgi:hypothetical protein
LFISSALLTIIGILSLSLPFLFLGGFSDARGGRGGRSRVTSSVSRWVAKAWACGLEIWTADLETFNSNIFNGRSGDLLDGCGVFGVDGYGLVVNLLWFCWGFGSWWVAVACGGFISWW